jgi:hypothetical protein
LRFSVFWMLETHWKILLCSPGLDVKWCYIILLSVLAGSCFLFFWVLPAWIV